MIDRIKRQGDKSGMKVLVRGLPCISLLLLIAHAGAWADEATADRVLQAYRALQGYCDTVDIRTQSQDSPLRLQRCYTQDGRHKTSTRSEPTGWTSSEWGDTTRSFLWNRRHDGSTVHYGEKPPSNRLPGEEVTVGALGVFVQAGNTETMVRDALRAMVVAEESNGTLVLRSSRPGPVGNELVSRIWVRRADGFVVRAEQTSNGQLVYTTTLVEARANPTLSDTDLMETAPFFHRYSLESHPLIFLGVLTALSLGAGVLLSIAWRGPHDWGRYWRIYAKCLGVAAGVIAAFALLTLVAGGGHPPPIVLAALAGVFAGIGALALALLLLGMQLGAKVFDRRVVQAPR
jgi:outer membrane lipoprotein-sorting protein